MRVRRGEAIDDLRPLGGAAREADERGVELRVLAAQRWEELAPGAHPGEPAVLVHRVLPGGEPARSDVRVDGGAIEREQRAREPAARGRDPGEAGGAGAAQEAEQHGLGLIARRVADEDARGAELVGESLERGIARGAGGRLDGGAARHGHALDGGQGAAAPPHAATPSATAALPAERP